ncbi:hypothetical protein MTAT_04470 [Moorella thermoacetica]|uniref:Uncharacterized protein n=1 Tax=Neomoorella thermoacetica TaxID=1525 RepID=A0AAC9HIW3_NEOTH|nr:RidA family protein [Moorella thermoacetica]AOQ24754.1 hypothetical protein Maut_02326 [Moorella thermoacetica]TYL15708.1 hypothetical protein MTAT_04470 [Moorella thermoacetica]
MLVHISVSDADEQTIEKIDAAIKSVLGDKYDVVTTIDKVQLYLQDPEALERINERLDIILEEVQAIKQLFRPLFIAGGV